MTKNCSKQSEKTNKMARPKLEARPKTILCDIDGVLLKHTGNISRQYLDSELLDGVQETLAAWDLKGYCIILISGRRESTRINTEKQLSELGIFYDQLILGATGGIRVLINDCKPNSTADTAVAISLERNKGIRELQTL